MAQKRFETALVITGDAKGGARAIKLTREQLQELTKVSKSAGAGLDKTSLASKQAAVHLGHLRKESKLATKALSSVKGAASVALGGLAAFGVASFFGGTIKESELLQRNLLRTEQLIKSTGSAAGFTASQLHDQARQLALGTLESTEGIMQAQQVMLTFKSVTGDTFTRATELAMDLATVTGVELKGSMTQLGKALEDPVKGINAMTRSGVSFTESQKEVIKALVATGDKAAAQKVILDELARQYGGVAKAEAVGYAGSIDTLGQSYQELQQALGDTITKGETVPAIFNSISDVIFKLTDAIKASDSWLEEITVTVTALSLFLARKMLASLTAYTVATARATAGTIALNAAAFRAAPAMAASSVAMGGATVAARGLAGVIGLVGGPLGLLALAGIAAYSYRKEIAELINGSNDAKVAEAAHGDELERIRGLAYKAAGGSSELTRDLQKEAKAALKAAESNIELARARIVATKAAAEEAKIRLEDTQNFGSGLGSPGQEMAGAFVESDNAEVDYSDALKNLDVVKSRYAEISASIDNIGKSEESLNEIYITSGGLRAKAIKASSEAAKEAGKEARAHAKNVSDATSAQAVIAKKLTDSQKAHNKIMEEGKSLTQSLRNPQESYNDSLSNLNNLLSSGSITQETYNRALLASKAALNDATGVTKLAADREAAHNKIKAEGKALTESLLGPQALHNVAVANLDKLLAAGAITQETYNESLHRRKKALNDATGVTKAAKEREAAHNKIKAEGKALTESLLGPQALHNVAVANLDKLLAAGAITQETYNESLLRRKKALNDATGVTQVAKEREEAHNKIKAEGKALTESLLGPQALHNVAVANLDKLLAAGAITQETYNESLHRRKKALNDATGVTQLAKDKQHAYNKVMDEGKALTKSLRSPQEIHNAAVENLDMLLAAGAITQQTYNAELLNRKIALNDANGVTEAARIKQDAYNKVMEEGKTLKRSLRTDTQKLADETDNLDRLFAAGAIDVETYNLAINKLGAELDSTQIKAKKMADEVSAMASGMTDSITSGLLSGDFKSIGNTLVDTFKNDILAPVMKNAIEPFTKAMSNTMGGIGNSISSAMGGSGSLFGQSGGGIMSMLKGGGVSGALGAGSLGMAFGQALGQTGIGSSIGAALGNILLPGLGGIIGGGLGALAEGMFGGKAKVSGSGVTAAYSTSGGFAGNQYKDMEKKKSFFRGTKRWRETSALDNEVTDSINGYFDTVDSIVTSQAEYFGKDAEALLSDFSVTAKSFTGEDIEAQVTAWSKDVTADIYQSVFGEVIENFGRSGEEVSDTISRLIMQAETVSSAFTRMGNDFDYSATKMVEISEGLVSFSGGIDNLKANMQGYYDLVYTSEEQATLARDQAQNSIDAFNESMMLTGKHAITSASTLRDYVEGLNISSASGQAAMASAMALSGAIATVAGSAEDAAIAAAELAAELAEFGGASAIRNMAEALYGSIDERYSAELARYEELKAGANSLRATIEGFADSLKDPKESLSDAQRDYNKLLAQAQSGDASVIAELNASAVTLKAALNDSYYAGSQADLGVSQIIGQLEQVATTLDLQAGDAPVNSQIDVADNNSDLAIALVAELKTLSLAKDTSIADLMLENGIYASSLAESFGIDIGGLGDAYSVIGQSQLSAISSLTDHNFGFSDIAESLGVDIAALSEGLASSFSAGFSSLDGLSEGIKNQLSPYLDAIVGSNNYDQLNGSILSLQAYISDLPDGIQGSLNSQLEDLIGANYLIDSSIKGLSLGQVEELKDYLSEQGFDLADVTIDSLTTLSAALNQFDVGLYALVDGLQLEIDGISDAMGSSMSQLARGIFEIDQTRNSFGKVVNDDQFELEKSIADDEINRLSERIFAAASSTALEQSVDDLQDFLRTVELESWIVDKDKELIASMDSLISSIETGAAYVGKELVDGGFNALWGNEGPFVNFVPTNELATNSFNVGSDGIDRDQLAQIHKGEAIFTAAQTGSLRTDTLKALRMIPQIAKSSSQPTIVIPNVPGVAGGGSTQMLDEIKRLRKNSDAMNDEMIKMREEASISRAHSYQIAKNTGKTDETLKRWDYDGQPTTRVTA